MEDDLATFNPAPPDRAVGHSDRSDPDGGGDVRVLLAGSRKRKQEEEKRKRRGPNALNAAPVRVTLSGAAKKMVSADRDENGDTAAGHAPGSVVNVEA